MEIWDTFLYSGERELLKLRLQMLNPLVDHFVIVESTRTFSGNLRLLSEPLFREDLQDSYPGKINWIILEESMPSSTAWQRESWQRNQINLGMKRANKGDIVMLSDLDEIPNPNFIHQIKGLRNNEVRVAQMDLYFYEFDFKSERIWFGTAATTWNSEIDFQALRNRVIQIWNLDSLEKIDSGGVHMSSIGNSQNLKRKIRSFSHTEFNVFPFNNRAFLGILIFLGICFDGSEVLKLSRDGSFTRNFGCHRKHRLDSLRLCIGRVMMPFIHWLYMSRVGNLSAPI
jgi:beta-1,4-mannosyl-glycoprotein beta-1,4-N-acetylglucosaminyltransferase